MRDGSDLKEQIVAQQATPVRCGPYARGGPFFAGNFNANHFFSQDNARDTSMPV